MQDDGFRAWLTRRSWGQMVRYCRAVAWLLPLAMAAKDVPIWLSGDAAQVRRLPELVAWQLAIGSVVVGIVLLDRAWPRLRDSEPGLYAACALYMALITWAGVTAIRTQGTGLAIFAACSTFMAGVVATPRPVRAPMYVLALVALAAAAWERLGSAQAVVGFLVNPFCVVVLCLALDRFTWSRDRALFVESRRAQAERDRADELLADVLPSAVAQELKATGRVQARRFDNLGVLFADLVGFTTYASRMPPGALVVVLDGIFTAFDSLAQKHGVEKIKTIGDAYMVASDGRIAALCALALDLHGALERYNHENGTALSMRIGVHAGPAVAGVLGVHRPLYDVWGDTVNVASRLQHTAEAGGTQVSESVVRQAGGFAFEARGLVELAGRGRVLTWRLLGAAEADASRDAGSDDRGQRARGANCLGS